jgi:hypothetical protein
MPATAVTAPASCSARQGGDAARRSPKTTVPMSTADIGSALSMTGRLADSAPARNVLAASSRPTAPRTASAQGCQWPSSWPRPCLPSSLVTLSVSALVRPKTAPPASARRLVRAEPRVRCAAMIAAPATSATAAKASAQS